MTTFIAIAKDGELSFSEHNRYRLQDHLKENEGKRYKIEKIEPKRSLSQNNFYWAWLHSLEMETGNNSEDLHLYLKDKLLPRKFITIKGRTQVHQLEKRKSTTELTKLEFGDYLDKCSALTGYPLPTTEQLEAMGYLK